MSINKKLKKYADGKMEELKDDEFFNSVNDAHFTNPKKPKSTRKLVMSVTASLVAVFAIVLTVTLTIQYTVDYNTSQYVTKDSTLTELNEDCAYFQFAENNENSVKLILERSSNEKLFYDVKFHLNGGTDVFSFICIINNKYNYHFETYDQKKQYGDYTLYYRLTTTYDSNADAYKHSVYANLLTDKERIAIRYTGISYDDSIGFFELLSTILTIN